MDAQTRLEIQNLTEQQQQYVIQTLPVKEKSLSSAYIFWVLFGAHYFYLNKPFKNIFCGRCVISTSALSGGFLIFSA